MGAWGAGLFSDDAALDVRADWETLYKRFGEPVQTTRELLREWDADDPDQGPVIILALAMCQWKYGCLQDDIKNRALEIVRAGEGLQLWEDSTELGRRKAVYQKIAETLRKPQPARKRIAKLTPPNAVPYQPGQLLSYRCWDGEFILLWVQGFCRYKGEKLPLCAALDWKGPTLPEPAAIRALKPIVTHQHRWMDDWIQKQASKLGETLPPAPKGLPWSGFAPREISKHGFDPSRVEVVAGEWRWDLTKLGQGPYVPRWIEVGPSVAADVSAAVAFKKTLHRVEGDNGLEGALPSRPRRAGDLVRTPRPLGIDVELPLGKRRKNSALLTLKRTKHAPSPGDIFVVNVKGKRWVAGRVILNDAHFACGPADVLVYFHKQEFNRAAEIMVPTKLDLLIPPCAAHGHHWSGGEFFHVANVPLEASELPARHVFGPGFDGYYRDAYGLPTLPPERDEIVGTLSVMEIGGALAVALGLR